MEQIVWFSVTEFEVAVSSLPLFDLRYSAGILIWPGNGLVNFAYLWKEGPWLSPDSPGGLRLPQRSRPVDREVVVT